MPQTTKLTYSQAQAPGILGSNSGSPDGSYGHLTTHDAAAYLRLSVRTLEKWRLTGGGPRYVKLGTRVLYVQGDLETWVETQARTSTSDPGPVPPTPRARLSVLPARRRATPAQD